MVLSRFLNIHRVYSAAFIFGKIRAADDLTPRYNLNFDISVRSVLITIPYKSPQRIR